MKLTLPQETKAATRQVPYVNLAAQHAPLRERLLHAIGKVLDEGQFILGREVEDFLVTHLRQVAPEFLE